MRPFFTLPLLLLRFLFDLSEHSDEEEDGGATRGCAAIFHSTAFITPLSV
jgi:hypothetical protein